MSRRKKEEANPNSFVNEQLNEDHLNIPFDLSNASIMNAFVIVKTIDSIKAEVVAVGNVNPLRLSIGDFVYIDLSEAKKMGDVYAIKFDDIIAKEMTKEECEIKQLIVEEKPETKMISESSFSNANINLQPAQQIVPAVDPPAYNVTRSFQKKKMPLSDNGIKHVDKPIRK